MSTQKPRAIGVNHVALEVGSIDEALEFYGALFAFRLRSRFETMAFIDLGDQFIALSAGRKQAADDERHFGLVVDDLGRARQCLAAAGVETFGSGLDFKDPWGNHIQLVEYQAVQFTKTASVLRGMGAEDLEKTPEALRELSEKGMAADDSG
jgi:catechol 2,3-dioxygenase-like lactoylglutathione lyase family enzyme